MAWGDAAWLADSRPADAAAHRRGERGRGEDLQAEPGGVPASGLPRRTGIGADLARVGERLGRAWREVSGAEDGVGASLAARALGRRWDRRARRGGRVSRRAGGAFPRLTHSVSRALRPSPPTPAGTIVPAASCREVRRQRSRRADATRERLRGESSLTRRELIFCP